MVAKCSNSQAPIDDDASETTVEFFDQDNQDVLSPDAVKLPDETQQCLPEPLCSSHPKWVKPSANVSRKRKVSAQDIQAMQYDVL